MDDIHSSSPKEHYIEEFLKYKKDLAPTTKESWTYMLYMFYNFIKTYHNDVGFPITKVNKDDIVAFQDYMLTKDNHTNKARKLKASTVKSYMIPIRVFYTYMSDFNHMGYNPAKQVEQIKVNKKEPEYLTPEEVQRLVEGACERDRLIVLSLYLTGLRVSEFLAVRKMDMDFDNCTMHCTVQKGGGERTVDVQPKLCEDLRKYSEKFAPEQRLFELDPATVRNDIVKLKAKAGITKNVTVHILRHSFAYLCINKGVEIEVLQKLMGHKSLGSTGMYLHFQREKLKKALNQATGDFPV